MEPPTIVSSLRDDANNTTYHVYAYRELERAEILACVKQYYGQKKNRRRTKPLRNAELKIVTIIGATGGLF